MKNKRIAILASAFVLFVFSIIPIPMHLKDGGTVVYKSILYSVENVHKLNADMEYEQTYLKGIVIKILGIEVFNNVD